MKLIGFVMIDQPTPSHLGAVTSSRSYHISITTLSHTIRKIRAASHIVHVDEVS